MDAFALMAASSSDESWWSHNSGSLLIAVAAITAAGLAAYVAIRNQRKQLEHDRELREIAHVRDTVDAATLAAGAARQAMLRSLATAKVVAGDELGGAASDHAQEMAEDSRDEAQIQLQPMMTQLARLDMRLGRGEQITRLYAEMLSALNEAVPVNPAETDVAGYRQREAELKKAFIAFQDACHAWFKKRRA